MSRIVKAYETQFGWMLRRAGARRPDEGVRWIMARAKQRSGRDQIPLGNVLAESFERLAAQQRLRRPVPAIPPERFFCDSGLGGLARWLRAAGYETEWLPYIDDDELIKRVRQSPAVLLTTDSMLMERKLLRDQVITAFWLPPIHSISRQLELVFREFHLELRASRCMHCGGELRQVAKDEMKEKIPPRTYKWIDEYFQCKRCGQLFWHGTHWKRISGRLTALQRGSAEGALLL
jgi:uncharacterized protein with PIN domain